LETTMMLHAIFTDRIETGPVFLIRGV